jgi:hypothetical protein
LASGFWLQASGFRLLAFAFWLSAFGFRLPASGFRLPASGFRLPASGLMLFGPPAAKFFSGRIPSISDVFYSSSVNNLSSFRLAG